MENYVEPNTLNTPNNRSNKYNNKILDINIFAGNINISIQYYTYPLKNQHTIASHTKIVQHLPAAENLTLIFIYFNVAISTSKPKKTISITRKINDSKNTSSNTNFPTNLPSSRKDNLKSGYVIPSIDNKSMNISNTPTITNNKSK